MSDLQELNRMLDEAIAEGIKSDPSMAEYRDWHYRDLPRMTPELMEEFREIIGDENLKWITFAKYDYGTSVRGQVLISPAGMQALADYKAQ